MNQCFGRTWPDDQEKALWSDKWLDEVGKSQQNPRLVLAKKYGSHVTNDDTVSESERGEKLQTMACLEPGTQPRPSQRQPCEFSEMLAALQNDISSLPREWNVWDWNLTVHIVSLSAPNFISPTWIEIQFSARLMMVMTVCLSSGEWGVCYQVTLDFCNVPPYPTLQSPAHLSPRYLQ